MSVNRIGMWFFRVLIISLIHGIFKHFDQSFSHFLSFGGRGVAFYAFFLSYGLLAWEGGIQIWKMLYSSFWKRFRPSERLFLLVLVYILLGVLVAWGFERLYALGDWLFFNRLETWETVGWLDFDIDVGIFLFYLIVLGFSGASYSIRQLQEAELVKERLAKAQLQSDFQALKNQIDPHFFFNSLSVLSSLIYKDPDLSDEYIGHLAKMYRYILDNKGKRLVRLKDEIRFLKSYLFLIQIRHQHQIESSIELSEETLENCLVPPHAVQMLVENAILTNAFTHTEPLWIKVSETDHQLVISNRLAARKVMMANEPKGIQHIADRYLLLGSSAPVIQTSESHYLVKLEKIYTENYESSHF